VEMADMETDGKIGLIVRKNTQKKHSHPDGGSRD